MNSTQYKQALIREREIHDLQMQKMRNQLELQYKVRLKDEEQTYLEEIGKLESQIEQMKMKRAVHQSHRYHGWNPNNYVQQVSSYPIRGFAQGGMVPGACPGECGRRQF